MAVTRFISDAEENVAWTITKNTDGDVTQVDAAVNGTTYRWTLTHAATEIEISKATVV